MWYKAFWFLSRIKNIKTNKWELGHTLKIAYQQHFTHVFVSSCSSVTQLPHTSYIDRYFAAVSIWLGTHVSCKTTTRGRCLLLLFREADASAEAQCTGEMGIFRYEILMVLKFELVRQWHNFEKGESFVLTWKTTCENGTYYKHSRACLQSFVTLSLYRSIISPFSHRVKAADSQMFSIFWQF